MLEKLQGEVNQARRLAWGYRAASFQSALLLCLVFGLDMVIVMAILNGRELNYGMLVTLSSLGTSAGAALVLAVTMDLSVYETLFQGDPDRQGRNLWVALVAGLVAAMVSVGLALVRAEAAQLHTLGDWALLLINVIVAPAIALVGCYFVHLIKASEKARKAELEKVGQLLPQIQEISRQIKAEEEAEGEVERLEKATMKAKEAAADAEDALAAEAARRAEKDTGKGDGARTKNGHAGTVSDDEDSEYARQDGKRREAAGQARANGRDGA